MEAKEGGKHHMSFRNFTTGNGHAFGGTYLKVVPGALLVYTDTFDNPHLSGEMKFTIELKAVRCRRTAHTQRQTLSGKLLPVGAERPLSACQSDAGR